MTGPENFLARWSRRKRAAAEDSEPAKADIADPRPDDAKAASADQAGAERAIAPMPQAAATEPVFDLSKLPPLESITAETDIRAFLTPGVPADLTRAALRRAWAADPTIRDFKGLADYDWDFTAPGALPGFGPLEMTDDLRRAVAEMVGRSLTPEPPKAAAASNEPGSAASALDSAVKSAAVIADQAQQSAPATQVAQEVSLNISDDSRKFDQSERTPQENIATQHSPESSQVSQSIGRRPHGRALPK
jgi:hypothetical protein